MFHRSLPGILSAACWLGLGTTGASGQPMALPPTDLAGPAAGVCPQSPPLMTPIPQPAVPIVQEPAYSPYAPTVVEPAVPAPAGYVPPAGWTGPWAWQFLPDGLMYKNYLAGNREPRFASQWVHDDDVGSLWDVTLGGHVGLLRYGTQDALCPEGWQIDAEGAAFPRLDDDRNLISVDFRFGVPLTTRMGPWEAKFGYYHLSSHLADEFLLSNPGYPRLNYSRESLVLGVAYRPFPDLRLYSEADWAFHTDGGARPWEFQFGADYSPMQPTGCCGAPFLAVNGRLRQDVDFGGNFTAQAGWQWRGATGHLLRIAAIYFNGKAEQRQFYRNSEELIGGGVFYDY